MSKFQELLNDIEVVKSKGYIFIKNEIENRFNGVWDLWKTDDCLFIPAVHDIVFKVEVREGSLYYHRNGVDSPYPISDLDIDDILSLVDILETLDKN
jgi:hypothetical protein